VIFDRTTLNTIAGLNRVPTDNWEVEAPADGRREIVVGGALTFGNAPTITFSSIRLLPGNSLEATFSAPVDGVYAIEESENLVDWNKIASGTFTSGSVVVPLGTVDPARDRLFFRAVFESGK